MNWAAKLGIFLGFILDSVKKLSNQIYNEGPFTD